MAGGELLKPGMLDGISNKDFNFQNPKPLSEIAPVLETEQPTDAPDPGVEDSGIQDIGTQLVEDPGPETPSSPEEESNVDTPPSSDEPDGDIQTGDVQSGQEGESLDHLNLTLGEEPSEETPAIPNSDFFKSLSEKAGVEVTAENIAELLSNQKPQPSIGDSKPTDVFEITDARTKSEIDSLMSLQVLSQEEVANGRLSGTAYMNADPLALLKHKFKSEYFQATGRSNPQELEDQANRSIELYYREGGSPEGELDDRKMQMDARSYGASLDARRRDLMNQISSQRQAFDQQLSQRQEAARAKTTARINQFSQFIDSTGNIPHTNIPLTDKQKAIIKKVYANPEIAIQKINENNEQALMAYAFFLNPGTIAAAFRAEGRMGMAKATINGEANRTPPPNPPVTSGQPLSSRPSGGDGAKGGSLGEILEGIPDSEWNW